MLGYSVLSQCGPCPIDLIRQILLTEWFKQHNIHYPPTTGRHIWTYGGKAASGASSKDGSNGKGSKVSEESRAQP